VYGKGAVCSRNGRALKEISAPFPLIEGSFVTVDDPYSGPDAGFAGLLGHSPVPASAGTIRIKMSETVQKFGMPLR